MKLKKTELGRRRRIRPKRFFALLRTDKNDGGRGNDDFNMAAERARRGTEGESAGCVKYASSGLALPCHESEKKLRR